MTSNWRDIRRPGIWMSCAIFQRGDSTSFMGLALTLPRFMYRRARFRTAERTSRALHLRPGRESIRLNESRAALTARIGAWIV